MAPIGYLNCFHYWNNTWIQLVMGFEVFKCNFKTFMGHTSRNLPTATKLFKIRLNAARSAL